MDLLYSLVVPWFRDADTKDRIIQGPNLGFLTCGASLAQGHILFNVIYVKDPTILVYSRVRVKSWNWEW